VRLDVGVDPGHVVEYQRSIRAYMIVHSACRRSIFEIALYVIANPVSHVGIGMDEKNVHDFTSSEPI